MFFSSILILATLEVCTSARAVTMDRRLFLDTDANMEIFNDWPTPLTVAGTNSEKMSDKPPGSMSIAPYSSSGGKYIEASAIPGQSSFRINFGTSPASYYDVNIGLTPYKTSFAGGSNTLNIDGGILAPSQPLTKGLDFNFYFFSGPGILPPLVNSVIQANLPAVASWISANNIAVTISDKVKLNINSIPSSGISCSYAAVSPAAGNNVWDVNVILGMTGTIGGNLAYNNHDADFKATVTDLKLLVQMTVNLGDYSAISASVTRVQTSIGDVELDGDILVEVLGFFYDGLVPILQLPYTIAGLINYKYNSDILKAINTPINNFLKTLKVPASKVKRSPKVAESLLKRTTPKWLLDVWAAFPNPWASTTEYSTWMSTPEIQAKTLSEIYIPGTHDSATYALQNALSLIKYDDIKFLWMFDYTSAAAPVNGTNPFATTPYYLGPTTGTYFLNSIKRISRAQDKTILQQLQDGIRYFDLRIYYDPADKQFYSQHGLKGSNLKDILGEVSTFMNTIPSYGEFIQLYISHTNFGDYPDALPSMTDLVNNSIKKWLYVPEGAAGTSNFDFQKLKDFKLSDITKGTPKVMILTSDLFTSGIGVNSDGYASSSGVDASAPGLFATGNAAALTVVDIAGNILRAVSGNAEEWALQVEAQKNNAVLPVLLQQYPAARLISVDSYESSTAGIPANKLIIEMNTKVSTR